MYFGGSGIAGFEPGVVALEAAATLIQCLNVSFVIDLPSTATTASPGMPAARGEADEGKQNGAKRRE